jgi:putative Ca2+/H+ antiporter (TMEM165/GDT1 family)
LTSRLTGTLHIKPWTTGQLHVRLIRTHLYFALPVSRTRTFMDIKPLLMVFASVLIAEVGDQMQLATSVIISRLSASFGG